MTFRGILMALPIAVGGHVALKLVDGGFPYPQDAARWRLSVAWGQSQRPGQSMPIAGSVGQMVCSR